MSRKRGAGAQYDDDDFDDDYYEDDGYDDYDEPATGSTAKVRCRRGVLQPPRASQTHSPASTTHPPKQR
jgi:hypothetical protein